MPKQSARCSTRRTATSAAESNATYRAVFQSKFLARIGSLDLILPIFDHLAGIFFFVKNARSQMVCASRPTLAHLMVARPTDLPGTTDHDYFPRHIADRFVRDDRTVMRTRRPLINHLEIWYNEQHLLDWFVTNKFPLYDRRGRVIGVFGTVQSYEGKRATHLPYLEVGRAVDHIRRHLHDRITVEDLAKISGLSPRQLHRKFRLAFNLSVQEFLVKTRLQAATHALIHTNRTLAEIALDHGYCDQSAFTHQFRRGTGVTPRKFRQNYSAEKA